MADFNLAYKLTAGIEGGYTVDNGGPTYKGISYNAWKNDPLVKKIFAIVFAAKPAKKAFINNAELDKMIVAFYKQNYWDKIKGDAIAIQTVANFVYDFYINSNSAPSIINNAIGLGRVSAFLQSTVNTLNVKASAAYQAIRDARKSHYDKLATQNPKFKKDGTYKGWLARLEKFPKSLTT